MRSQHPSRSTNPSGQTRARRPLLYRCHVSCTRSKQHCSCEPKASDRSKLLQGQAKVEGTDAEDIRSGPEASLGVHSIAPWANARGERPSAATPPAADRLIHHTDKIRGQQPRPASPGSHVIWRARPTGASAARYRQQQQRNPD